MLAYCHLKISRAMVEPMDRRVHTQSTCTLRLQFPGDRNAGLLEAVEAAIPNAVCLEMETHTLMELAQAAGGSIAACGAAMVVWNRHTKQSIGEGVDG